ncbi:MAG: GNAT family N-acetyltransferase [Rhodopseudomonas sp.]|nr:GNAT family N-acetyltransferase [Rhodopseudomonas sp.]
MNVAVQRPFNLTCAATPGTDTRLARVEVFTAMAQAEPYWRLLETAEPLATPYQTFDFLDLWQHRIGAAEGVIPFIVVGFDGLDSPMFVWPLGLRRRFGLRQVEFMGGKHVNFNVALWRRDAAAAIGEIELLAILAQINDQADLLTLANQPLSWGGLANPFALLPHQASPSFGHSGALLPDFEAWLNARTNSSARKKMRKKERTLAGFGAVRFHKAVGREQIEATLASFFEQKSARMRALGLPDAYAEPAVRQFITAAALTPSADGSTVIELYALTLDGEVIATLGGMVGNGRFSGMFSSIIHGQYGAESPGEQLLLFLVQELCRRGLTTFDLGIGEARYKGVFCPDADPMFDSYWPLTPLGRVAATGLRLACTAKRTIKQHPLLWSLVIKARRLRGRLVGQTPG